MGTVNPAKRLTQILRAFVNFGTSGEKPPAHNGIFDKRTRLVNVLSILCSCIGLFSLPFDWVTAPRWMVAEDAASFVLFLLVPFINRAGMNQLGRMVFLFLGNLIISVDAVLIGVPSGIDLMFFGLAAFALAIFDLTEKRLLAVATLVPVTSYFWLHSRPAGYALDPLPAEMARSYSMYSALVVFVCIGVSVYFLQKMNFLSETELRTSRAQAISSEKMAALGEMSSSLAHEINTPLMALQLNAALLKKEANAVTPDYEKVEQRIEKIDGMIERITKVTATLQAFARNAELDPLEMTAAQPLISDVLELCQERFKNARVDLRVDPLPAGLMLKCRGVQISQVLLNLMNNSLHAVSGLETKWVRIHVESRVDCVRISVVDSGNGISAEIQERLFQPFFTTKAPGKGTGLGLSISKGILEAHGGRIFLETVSKNTEFVLELPKG